MTSRILAALGFFAAANAALAAAAAPPADVPDKLDLETAIGFAVQNNFAIRQARERIQQQEGVVLEVSSRKLPTASASGTLEKTAESLSVSFPPSDRTWALAINVSQTLYSGGA